MSVKAGDRQDRTRSFFSVMSELWTPEARFEGFGVTGANAAEASAALARRLNAWSTEFPGRRILHVSVQSAAVDTKVELTAVIAYVEEAGMVLVAREEAAEEIAEEKSEVVSLAEEIVAEAQQDSP